MLGQTPDIDWNALSEDEFAEKIIQEVEQLPLAMTCKEIDNIDAYWKAAMDPYGDRRRLC